MNTVKNIIRTCTNSASHAASNFETVFSFPFIKYIALFQRLKTYHIFGTSVSIPCCALLELFNVIPQDYFSGAAYIGLTGVAVLSAASVPFNNIIGFLYITDDNKQIKISSINFWGKRQDKIIKSEDWIPLLDMPPKKFDPIFLSPQLLDGSKYKLFVKFGNVLNASKMGQVLE